MPRRRCVGRSPSSSGAVATRLRRAPTPHQRSARCIGIVGSQHHGACGCREPLDDIGVVRAANLPSAFAKAPRDRSATLTIAFVARSRARRAVGRGQKPAEHLRREHSDVVGHGGTISKVRWTRQGGPANRVAVGPTAGVGTGSFAGCCDLLGFCWWSAFPLVRAILLVLGW